MIAVTLEAPDDFEGWRDAVRRLIAAGVDPAGVSWRLAGGDGELFGAATPPPGESAQFGVPKAFIPLARASILHSDPERFALLHGLLAGLVARTRRMDDAADPLIVRLEAMAKAVRRDIHKMRAFVRFRKVEEGDRYVAWFEPEHHIVRANAPFFIDRFASMHWSILTPAISIHWDGTLLTEGPGAVRGDAPDGDPVEDSWKRYYASIFNPSRLKVGAMLKEMPKKYWHNMPETALVGGLIAGAQARSAAMIAAAPRAPAAPVPAPARSMSRDERMNASARGGIILAPKTAVLSGSTNGVGDNATHSWTMLRDEAARCKRCPLYAPATQTVFGEGPLDAALMLVGEQPGDSEDLAGRAFVGPAGQLLDAALEEAGIDRAQLYVTNAVKHFKFEQRGKRRIHSSPNASEIEACRWWVDRERELIKPRVTLALGATAARSLFGKVMPVGKSRGQALTLADGAAARITMHPSYLLRLPDRELAERERAGFVADLAAAYEQATGG